MLRKASASSSKLTSTTRSDAYHASIFLPPPAGKAAHFIAHHAVAERCIALHVLVCIDDDLVDLRSEALEYPLHHRLAVQQLQALIDAAHAAALAAGENDAAHLAHGNGFYE